MLLRLLLFLLTYADFEVLLFGFLIRLMIMPANGISQIRIDVGALRQHCHQREIVFAVRAKGPEPLHVRDCHTQLV